MPPRILGCADRGDRPGGLPGPHPSREAVPERAVGADGPRPEGLRPAASTGLRIRAEGI